jgi:hypothetical protein
MRCEARSLRSKREADNRKSSPYRCIPRAYTRAACGVGGEASSWHGEEHTHCPNPCPIRARNLALRYNPGADSRKMCADSRAACADSPEVRPNNRAAGADSREVGPDTREPWADDGKVRADGPEVSGDGPKVLPGSRKVDTDTHEVRADRREVSPDNPKLSAGVLVSSMAPWGEARAHTPSR